jgi:hypothetical protein
MADALPAVRVHALANFILFSGFLVDALQAILVHALRWQG